MNTEKAIGILTETKNNAKKHVIDYDEYGLGVDVFLGDAIILAIEAIREKQAREKPKPLTLEELKARIGMPVLIVQIGKYKASPPYWAIVGKEWATREGLSLHDIIDDEDGGSYHTYGKTWTAYDHEPKEEKND